MLKMLSLLILNILLNVGCDGDSSSGRKSTVSNSIVGTWSFVYPSNGCTETYIYNIDGSWSASSLDEIQTGTYIFSETVNTGERHALSSG